MLWTLICVCVCVRARVGACMHACMLCACMCVYACIHVHVCMHVCVHVHVCADLPALHDCVAQEPSMTALGKTRHRCPSMTVLGKTRDCCPSMTVLGETRDRCEWAGHTPRWPLFLVAGPRKADGGEQQAEVAPRCGQWADHHSQVSHRHYPPEHHRLHPWADGRPPHAAGHRGLTPAPCWPWRWWFVGLRGQGPVGKGDGLFVLEAKDWFVKRMAFLMRRLRTGSCRRWPVCLRD